MFRYLVVLASLAHLFLIVAGIDCENDPNTEPGCGNSCVTCSNYNEPCVSDDICLANGCNCISGYIIDEATDTCVLPQDCSSGIGFANNPYAEIGCGNIPSPSCGTDTLCDEDSITCSGFAIDESYDSNTLIPPQDCNPPIIVEEPEVIEPDVCANDDSVSEFREATIDYTAAFLNSIIQANPNNTVTGSPIATLYILGLFGLYSYGDTLNQILTALNLENQDQIRCSLTQVNDVLTSDPNNAINLDGSNIFGNIQYTFTEDFTKDMEDVVIGQVFNVDFSRPDIAANTINSVVAEESDNEITNIVSGDDFNEDTQLATVTGLVFKGVLQQEFNPDNSIIDSFFEAGNTVADVEYLFNEDVYSYAYSNKLKSQVLELPFVATYTGFVILPDSDTDVSCVIDQLGNYRTFDSVLKSLTPTVVDLFFPSFDVFTTTIDAKSIAQENLNVTLINDPDKAQFENIVVDDLDVSVSFGIQKFLFESNPGQTTSIPSEVPDDLPSVELKLNRPFIFLITINVDSEYFPIICGYRATAA